MRIFQGKKNKRVRVSLLELSFEQRFKGCKSNQPRMERPSTKIGKATGEADFGGEDQKSSLGYVLI